MRLVLKCLVPKENYFNGTRGKQIQLFRIFNNRTAI